MDGASGGGGNGVILAAIADVKSEVRAVRKDVGKIDRELGGVQSTLTSMDKGNVQRDTDLKELGRLQSECSARTGMVGVNARLKKLEREDEDITGKVDTVAQRQQALEMGIQQQDSVPFFAALKKMLPWLIVAIIGGAAVGGYLLAMSMIGS